MVSRTSFRGRWSYFLGWKRFEMNETLKFHRVTEMTFPSIMRRSLIINCEGRFVSAQRLAHPGHPGALSHAGGHERFRDLRRTWPSTRTAPVTGSLARPGAGVVQSVAARQVPGWLLGDEEGLVRCHVSLVKRCLERGCNFTARSTTSAGCTRTCGPGCRPGTVWGPCCN